MDQDHRRPAAGDPVDHAVAVQLDLPRLESRSALHLAAHLSGEPPGPPICFDPVPSKDKVRQEIWKAMDREGVSRFPGAEGRIPNFAGAKLAAERLAAHRLWKRARVIKANPDSPQTHARRLPSRKERH